MPRRGIKKNKRGFTDKLAIYLLLFLVAGLVGGFYLAVESIQHNYVGALACWTIVFGPIGTAVSVVLGKIVDKNKAENTSGGIKFATAQALDFIEDGYISDDINSPAI